MKPGDSITVPAYAKVNLALAVGPPVDAGPRKGWHPISSWMAAVSLSDTLTLRRLPDDSLSRYAVRWDDAALRKSAIDWSITKDLAVRAHLALEGTEARALPVQMRLDKRTPVGGGLGGGSSDAAAALRATAELFGVRTAASELRALSGALGSDVAFFLDEERSPRPALVEGFGDRIERMPGARGSLVLLFPEFGCPTPEVYRAFDAVDAKTSFESRAESVRGMALAADVRGDLFNDLAAPAELVAPGLRDLRAAVEAATAVPAHVTGSGSTLFLVASDPDHAEWLTRAVGEAFDPARLAALAVGLV
ncbi:MAG: hypothetical protein IBJ10_07235 [Phycisphaerales bacterium]|nr:hypothetical protein [Phycisphaerales bacterium]